MRILGIDTSGMVCSVALIDGDSSQMHFLSEPDLIDTSLTRALNHPHHAVVILPLIRRLLSEFSTSLNEISAIAVTTGPGSFTGLRIALSLVKGLAFGSSMAIVEVPTLVALAERPESWKGMVCPILDARKNEVYAALYLKDEKGLKPVMEASLLSWKSLPAKIRFMLDGSRPCLFLGDGVRTINLDVRTVLGKKNVFTLGEEYPPTAAAAARVGLSKYQSGQVASLDSLHPYYLRSPDAQIKNVPLTNPTP